MIDASPDDPAPQPQEDTPIESVPALQNPTQVLTRLPVARPLILGFILILIALNQAVYNRLEAQLNDSLRLYTDLSHRLAAVRHEQQLELQKKDTQIASQDASIQSLQDRCKVLEGMLRRAEIHNKDLQAEWERYKVESHGEAVQFQKTSVGYQRKMGEAQQRTFSDWVQTTGNLRNLEVAHERLTAKYNELVSVHNELQAAHSVTLAALAQLQSEHQQLSASYERLQYSYNTLVSNYQSLQARAAAIAQRADQIAADYEQLRQQYNQLYAAYRRIGGY